jgi:hypothetical protein
MWASLHTENGYSLADEELKFQQALPESCNDSPNRDLAST